MVLGQNFGSNRTLRTIYRGWSVLGKPVDICHKGFLILWIHEHQGFQRTVMGILDRVGNAGANCREEKPVINLGDVCLFEFKITGQITKRNRCESCVELVLQVGIG